MRFGDIVMTALPLDHLYICSLLAASGLVSVYGQSLSNNRYQRSLPHATCDTLPVAVATSKLDEKRYSNFSNSISPIVQV